MRAQGKAAQAEAGGVLHPAPPHLSATVRPMLMSSAVPGALPPADTPPDSVTRGVGPPAAAGPAAPADTPTGAMAVACTRAAHSSHQHGASPCAAQDPASLPVLPGRPRSYSERTRVGGGEALRLPCDATSPRQAPLAARCARSARAATASASATEPGRRWRPSAEEELSGEGSEAAAGKEEAEGPAAGGGAEAGTALRADEEPGSGAVCGAEQGRAGMSSGPH